MIRKNDAERYIRHLCHEWRNSESLTPTQLEHPSFTAFKAWLKAKGYGHYLDFHSVGGPDYAAERWFDEEFCQAWRN